MSTDDPRDPHPEDGGQNPPPQGGWGPTPQAGGDEGGQPTSSGPTAGGDTLEADPSGPGARRVWLVPVVAVVVLVLCAGAAFAVVSALRGGGEQPEQVVPGDALAFAKLDLDPSAGQKISALRFLRKFPQLEDDAKGEDLRKALFEGLADENGLDGVDYAKDVEPWLGQRVGFAALPPAKGGTDPLAVVAVQVTDEDAARDGIAKITESSGEDEPGVVFTDGYALVAETQKTADDAAQAAGEKNLADSGSFSADMDAIGETGVSSGWFDLDGLADVVGSTDPSAAALVGGSSQLSGRVAYAVRFDGDDLEAVAKARGVKGVTEASGDGDNGLARLPGSTVAALGFANGDELVTKGWAQALEDAKGTPTGQQLETFVAQAEAFGFSLPDDLGTLFGSSFALAVDGDGLTGSVPRVGARVTTDTAKAQAVLDKIESLVGPMMGQYVTREPTDDGLVLATEGSYARKLATDGDLGGSDGFTAALPGVEDADFAMWVDVDRLAGLLGSQVDDPDARKAMEAVDAIGLEGTVDGPSEATYTVRVITR